MTTNGQHLTDVRCDDNEV